MRDYRCLDGMIANSETMMKTAYEKGYKQGQQDNADLVSNRTKDIGQAWYNKGIKDMFDAIYKIVALKVDGGMSLDDIEEIFGTESSEDIVRNFKDNPKGIIENIREYKASKEKKPVETSYCSYIQTSCPYNVMCESCDVYKSFWAARKKVKEKDND